MTRNFLHRIYSPCKIKAKQSEQLTAAHQKCISGPMANDAKKEVFQMSKAAGKKSDAAQRKVKDLMKRAKAGEDVDEELEAAVKGMESCNDDLFASIEALKTTGK